MPLPAYVLPALPSSAPLGLALLGEAPGAEEVVERAPFVGTSGHVLDRLLRAANIERSGCWVGNVFPFRLPRDDVLTLCAGAREHKAWGPSYTLAPLAKGKWMRPEHTGHVERTQAVLRALASKVIVPLGGTALWALTGLAGISDFRGTLMRRDDAWVLPTFHPAAVARQWKLFPTAARDLTRAAEIARGRTPSLIAPEIEIASRAEQISALHARLRASGEIAAVDIETARGQIDTIAIATRAHALVAPFVDLAAPSRSWWPSVEAEVRAIGLLRALLEDAAIPKVLQYGAYDAYWLARLWGVQIRGYAHDTKLAAHALYPELPKSLAYLGSVYADVAPWKHLGRQEWGARDETEKE